MSFHRVGFVRSPGAPLRTLLMLGILSLTPLKALAQDSDIHSLDQLSELPRLADARQAGRAINRAYPRSLQRQGIGGRVQLRFVVDADGRVDGSTVEVVAASVEELGEAAKAAAINLRFVTGKIDGSPVKTMVLFPISFVAGRP